MSFRKWDFWHHTQIASKPQVKGSVPQTPWPLTHSELGFWPDQLQIRSSYHPVLRLDHFLEWLTELRKTVYLLGYWFWQGPYKMEEMHRAGGRRQGTSMSFQACHLPGPTFTNQKLPKPGSSRIFMAASLYTLITSPHVSYNSASISSSLPGSRREGKGSNPLITGWFP